MMFIYTLHQTLNACQSVPCDLVYAKRAIFWIFLKEFCIVSGFIESIHSGIVLLGVYMYNCCLCYFTLCATKTEELL